MPCNRLTDLAHAPIAAAIFTFERPPVLEHEKILAQEQAEDEAHAANDKVQDDEQEEDVASIDGARRFGLDMYPGSTMVANQAALQRARRAAEERKNGGLYI